MPTRILKAKPASVAKKSVSSTGSKRIPIKPTNTTRASRAKSKVKKDRWLDSEFKEIVGVDPKIPGVDADGFITLNGHFKVHRGTYKILYRNIRKGENTLLLGPTGYGKTELVYHMANHLKVPLTIFDMGTMTDPIMGLVGTNTIQVEEGATVSKFVKSRFSEVIQKPGIVLLDELSRASIQANNLLFPCLDYRRELNMEYAFNDTAAIKIHPECVFFATANIGSQYSGTNKMDRALLDRFVLLEMDTLSQSQMLDILKFSYPTIAYPDLTTLVSIYEKINAANEAYTISFGLSFRHLKVLAAFVQDGFTIYDAYYTLCKGLAGKEGLKSIESILSDHKVKKA